MLTIRSGLFYYYFDLKFEIILGLDEVDVTILLIFTLPHACISLPP